jgi:hypothetical protein
MKQFTLLLFILVLLSGSISCNKQRNKKEVPRPVSSSEVNNYYFHFTRRCATCPAAGENAHKAVEALYSNAAGIIPIVSVLIEKGASPGTSLAFMKAVIGLSLPGMIILKKVLRLPFILTFTGIVAPGIMTAGFLFNAIM